MSKKELLSLREKLEKSLEAVNRMIENFDENIVKTDKKISANKIKSKKTDK